MTGGWRKSYLNIIQSEHIFDTYSNEAAGRLCVENGANRHHREHFFSTITPDMNLILAKRGDLV